MQRLSGVTRRLAGAPVDVAIGRWSILSWSASQRSLSDDTSSGPGGYRDEPAEHADGRPPSGQPRDVQDDQLKSARASGRGRGALSGYLRRNQRYIDKLSSDTAKQGSKIEGAAPVAGQFDDSDDVSGDDNAEKDRLSAESERGTSLSAERVSEAVRDRRGGTSHDEDEDGSSDDEYAAEDDLDEDADMGEVESSWQQQWFSTCKEDEMETLEEWGELDDDEEDDNWDLESGWNEDKHWITTEEEWQEYKSLGERLMAEEEEQFAKLGEKWNEMRREAAEKGELEGLEPPDLDIITEFVAEAEPGTAEFDRPKPMPRSIEDIVKGMELPSNLEVSPDDPEYPEVVKMWTAVSGNKTMSLQAKQKLVQDASKFIKKYRNNDGVLKQLLSPPRRRRKKKKKIPVEEM